MKRSSVPFWEHAEELRRTLIRVLLSMFFGAIATFLFHTQLFALLLKPLSHNQTLYLFGPTEGLTTVLKVTLWGGILLSSPLWSYFLLQFFLPALRRRERGLIFPFLALSALFIAAGTTFAYLVTLPLVTRFFHHFNANLGENLWGLSQTLSFSLTLILAHGIVFELYVVLLFLVHFRVIHHSHLRVARRPMIVVTLLLAALLTPPDLLSQLLLALPMLFLYEGVVLYSRK